MRLVLDTNVVASGLLWDGAPRRLMTLSSSQRVSIYTSVPLLVELTDILSRPKFEKKIAASLLSVDELVYLYASTVYLVRPRIIPRLAPDPDDDIVIGTAIAASAELIVTGDQAFLSVATFENGRIVSVTEALNRIDAG